MHNNIDETEIAILNNWLDEEIDITIKLVRIGIKALATLENGVCKKTNGEIARYINISERTTKRAIKALKEIGYIENIEKKSGYKLVGKYNPEPKGNKVKGDAYTGLRKDLLRSRISYQIKMLIIAIRSYIKLPMVEDSLLEKRMSINVRYVREYKEEARDLGFITYREVEKGKFKYELHYDKIANYAEREVTKNLNRTGTKQEVKTKTSKSVQRIQVKAPRSTRKIKGSEDSNSKVSVRIYI